MYEKFIRGFPKYITKILLYLMVVLTAMVCFAKMPMKFMESMPEDTLAERISELKSRYPPGKYWNPAETGFQFMEFTFKLGYEVFGTRPEVSWKKLDTLDNVQVGDIIAYENNNHYIFVTDISGDRITFADCNTCDHSVIRWDVEIHKKDITGFRYVYHRDHK